MKFLLKNCLPHVLVLIGFVLVSLLYFNPVLKGKKIFQSDIAQYTGMAKQQIDFRTETGEETYWTNSAFGGMPTYQLGAKYPHNYIKKLDSVLRFLPRPADYLFLYFIGFYVFLLVLKVDFKLAALGALAFGFSTYLIIILGVGHNAKAHAIGYMPFVLSGILLTFQRKYIMGFLLTAIALGLELYANHFQMTYYLLLLVIIIGIVYLIDAVRKKELKRFFISVGVLIPTVFIAVGLNATNIMATQEYVKQSTRSKSELTINPDGSSKAISDGLDYDYITQYSYGKVESLNLFIPRFMGGGSSEKLGKDSETFKFFRSLGAPPNTALQEANRAPAYWGDQPFVEAPAYVGAVIIFLFVLGLFLVKGRLKYWLVAGAVLSLLLSFGKNLSGLTDLFIDYVPLYNKFRAVSSIQVILELCVPVLAIFALLKLFKPSIDLNEKLKALKYTTLVTVGLALALLVFKTTVFDFSGAGDERYLNAYGPNFISALKADRISIFTEDTIRSLVLVLLSAAVIFFFLKEKIKKNHAIIIFAGLIVFDLVTIDRRYVNNDDFVSVSRLLKPYTPTDADKMILEDDSVFRVYDITTGSTRPNYFHNSVNGYHAAKMRRFNELYDFYIVRNNMEVLNMLNTKYIIAEREGQIFPYRNEDANGNAWFIKKLIKVESANKEIKALDSINNKIEAVYQNPSKKSIDVKSEYVVDSTATITLDEYKPNYIKYESNNANSSFVVFSENYYGEGWQAYIDGAEVEHMRVNYILRGLAIPKGKHTIEFKFDPQVVKTGSKIALASSIVMVLLLLGGLLWEFNTSKAKKSA